MSVSNTDESDDGDQSEYSEPPAPEVEAFSLDRLATGEVHRVSVTVEYWDEDHCRTVDIKFTVDPDGVAKLLSQNVGAGSLLIERDLVPIITATMALEEADFEGIEKVQTVKDRVSKARHEARRADLEVGAA